MKYEEFEYEEVTTEVGCGFCWDKRKQQTIELYFIDRANNMRVCNYCPSCGRSFDEEVP